MTAKKRVLLVDDDLALRSALAEQLSMHPEFEVESVGAGNEALDRTRQERFDLLLLDVGLPDIDGRDVCRTIRQSGLSMPIIMLTAAATEADELKGFDSGINDYVTKPFRLASLLARMRTHLRQYEQSEDAVFRIGPYAFRPSGKVLTRDGSKTKVRLTEKETAILKYLCRIGNRLVTREVLLSEVWGYNAGVTTHTLETHIYRLRQKMEVDPAKATLLLTEPGGYRLNV
ncbi:MAG: response regulator transcription factor [Alphaproteobacteria bacterium]|nr:response regulator transcription factor [Alphaproteobacteria bacterium]